MKIIAIGDLHGKDCWKKVVFDPFDYVIFIGDYTDSFTTTNEEIYQNLIELVTLKKTNPQKFILLLGNHDVQYLHFPDFRCSGFRAEAQWDLTIFFKENKTQFHIAWQIRNYLFTHAGVSNKWFRQHEWLFHEYGFPEKQLSDAFNTLHENTNENYCLFDCGKTRGGLAKHGGILWADAEETVNDFLPGYHQVVGHTPVLEMARVGDDVSSITYIDVLDQKNEFLELEI